MGNETGMVQGRYRFNREQRQYGWIIVEDGSFRETGGNCWEHQDSLDGTRISDMTISPDPVTQQRDIMDCGVLEVPDHSGMGDRMCRGQQR